MSLPPEVLTAVDILRSHEVEFVVVGGQAVLRRVPRATGDVDAMVTTSDYVETVLRLRGDPRLVFRSESDGVAQFYVRPLGDMGLDVLDAGSFSGDSPGAAFYDFVVGESSSTAEGVRFASLEAVWYTRLMVPRWQVYADKILSDVIANASLGRVDEVRKIARRFGTERIIAPRIEYLREEAKYVDYDAK
ncbi:MAG: hypothetical protein L3K11_01565 [Thermoplasmata archaeon]|nr:hypothetical protein [Thermoplasmata archaeon]